MFQSGLRGKSRRLCPITVSRQFGIVQNRLGIEHVGLALSGLHARGRAGIHVDIVGRLRRLDLAGLRRALPCRRVGLRITGFLGIGRILVRRDRIVARHRRLIGRRVALRDTASNGSAGRGNTAGNSRCSGERRQANRRHGHPF